MRAPVGMATMASASTSTADAGKKQRMKSKSYGDAVIVSLGNLKKSDELCDFTVSAGGKFIKVRHRTYKPFSSLLSVCAGFWRNGVPRTPLLCKSAVLLMDITGDQILTVSVTHCH